MKKIIIALALCSAMLGMASCTRGGNIDRGDDGFIGHHGNRHDTTDVRETDNAERRYDDGIGDDIYNLPRDIRRGLDDAGDSIRDDLGRAGDDIRDGSHRIGDDVREGVRDNNMIK